MMCLGRSNTQLQMLSRELTGKFRIGYIFCYNKQEIHQLVIRLC